VTIAPADGTATPVRELPASRRDAGPKRDAKLVCETDADVAARRAQREGRPLLVHACAEWSVACKEQRKLFDDARVARAAAPYVCLVLDFTEETPENDALASRFGVVGLPSWSLLEEGGRSTHATGMKTADALVEELGAFVSR
jgi:thiol:disulfide interchange protein